MTASESTPDPAAVSDDLWHRTHRVVAFDAPRQARFRHWHVIVTAIS